MKRNRKDYKHLNRDSYFNKSETLLDDIKNYGFEYQGKLFRRSVSGLFFEDPKKERIFAIFDTLISYMIDAVKHIKKSRNYAIHKDYIKMK